MGNYALVEQAAVHAADLWMLSAPASMADWRDNRFKALVSGHSLPDYSDRQQAFNNAYAVRIGQAIAGGA